METSSDLNFFALLPTRISNGFVDGKNNRAKALMRPAYGYRHHQHLRLRIPLNSPDGCSANFPPKDGDPPRGGA